MSKKVNSYVKPVAWAGEKVLKYQGFLEYPGPGNRTIRLVGEPRSTEQAAACSVYNELCVWEQAIGAFKDEFTNFLV